MTLNNTFPLGDNEAVLYLSINWDDLSKESQDKIVEESRKVLGANSYGQFTFPEMEIRLLVKRQINPYSIYNRSEYEERNSL